MKNKSIIFIMIVSLFVFLSVTFWLTANNGYVYDASVIEWTEKVSTSFIMKAMETVSIVGSSEVILLLTGVIAVIFLFKRNWIYLLFFLTVSVGGVALNFLLKILFQRERPGGEVSNIEVFNLSLEIPSYSFPSGHMMRVTILFLFLMYISYRFIRGTLLKWLAYMASTITMIGVALSRLFLEAHFLSDIIGAISISIVWFCFLLLLFKKFQKPNHATYLRW